MTRRIETPEEAQSRLEQQSLSERERAELWARVAAGTDADALMRRRLRQWAVPLSINAVITVIALWFFWDRSDEQQASTPAPVEPCALDPNARVLRLPAQCGSAEVQINGDGWQLEEGASVARVPDGARVERGRVRFRVRPRKQPGDNPFVVKVSHAQVRVIGTVFVIDQRQSSGAVQVTEGVIEVLWHDGTRQRVAAGQSASWPRVDEPELGPLPAQPQAKTPDAGVKRSEPRARAAPDLDAVMERLLLLRSQKRYGEAVDLLRGTLAAPGLGAVQRERINYELGLALDASGAPSCAHWRDHAARFGQKRNARALKERLARCERD
jgi:hypothetical protein